MLKVSCGYFHDFPPILRSLGFGIAPAFIKPVGSACSPAPSHSFLQTKSDEFLHLRNPEACGMRAIHNFLYIFYVFVEKRKKTYGSVSKPCTPGEHQNSWDLWMFIPLKMVCIGIDS